MVDGILIRTEGDAIAFRAHLVNLMRTQAHKHCRREAVLIALALLNLAVAAWTVARLQWPVDWLVDWPRWGCLAANAWVCYMNAQWAIDAHTIWRLEARSLRAMVATIDDHLEQHARRLA